MSEEKGDRTMKRIMITLAILALVMMPMTVTAQTEEFSLIQTGVAKFEKGIFVDATVNWFEVMLIVRIDEVLMDQIMHVGDSPLNVHYELYYDYWGFAFGSVHEMVLEYINATLWFEDIDATGPTVDVSFEVPYPEVIPPPKVYPVIPENEYWTNEPDWGEEYYGRITTAGGMIIVIAAAWICLGPSNKRTRKKKRKAKWGIYKSTTDKKSVKDAIDTRLTREMRDGKKIYELNEEDIEAIKREDASNTQSEAERIAEVMGKEFEKELKALDAVYNDSPYYGPPPDAVALPDLSSTEDDEDWRACPYCGEWNRGKATRCINCDGRLGRPLGE